MQMEQMPNSNNSALKRENASVEDIVMKANPNLPHPVVSNCETVAYPSVECFVKERLESAIVLEEG